ncbi:MAG: hypothetical protein ACPLXP_02190 [Microgenomates group bacterium]
MNINYSSLLNRSWELTKKNKWLWVYGLVLATLGRGFNQWWIGFSGSSSGKLPKEIPPDVPQKTSQVLGQATSAFQQWLASVSPANWIILGLGILFFLLLCIIISWVIGAWAKGSLIAGLDKANEGQTPTLLSTSPSGIAAIKNLIVYRLMVAGFSLLIILILGTVFLAPGLLIAALNSQPLTIFWIIISGIVGGLSLVLTFLLLAMINIYAERLIVLHCYPPWQAWKKGLSLSKESFLPTIVMGIINQTIGWSMGCLTLIVLLVILGTPAIITLLPYFKEGFHMPSLPVFIFLFFLFLLFIYTNWLISAILFVFRYSNWNLLFKEILSKEETNGKQS